MSEQAERLFGEERPAGGSSRSGRGRMPMWKLALVGVSLVLMVAGLGLRGYAHMKRGGATESSSKAAPGEVAVTNARASQSGRSFLSNSAAGFKADDDPARTTPSKEGKGSVETLGEGLEAWSPAMFRMGFSFFVGFCIAYAVRTFFKMVTFGAGVVLLVLFVLQYSGVISVNWGVAQGYYDTAVNWLGVQTEGFQKFVTAQLPSAALAMSGMVVGYRRA